MLGYDASTDPSAARRAALCAAAWLSNSFHAGACCIFQVSAVGQLAFRKTPVLQRSCYTFLSAL